MRPKHRHPKKEASNKTRLQGSAAGILPMAFLGEDCQTVLRMRDDTQGLFKRQMAVEVELFAYSQNLFADAAAQQFGAAKYDITVLWAHELHVPALRKDIVHQKITTNRSPAVVKQLGGVGEKRAGVRKRRGATGCALEAPFHACESPSRRKNIFIIKEDSFLLL